MTRLVKTFRNKKFPFPVFVTVLFLLLFCIPILSGCTRKAIDDQTNSLFPTRFATISDLQESETPSALQTNQVTIELLETGYMGEDLLIIALFLPESYDQDYYGMLDSVIFDCTRQEEMADRLYCFGEVLDPGDLMVFTLYTLEEDIMIWETEFEYPQILEGEE